MSLRTSSAAFGLLVLALGSACTGASEDEVDSQEGAQTESRADYDFQLPGPDDEMARVDAMGVALVSTVLMNRDRRPDGSDNRNQYQIDTPDVQNSPRTLLTFVHFLRTLHKFWRDNLKDTGFEPCSTSILGIVASTPCTLQKLRFDEDLEKEGPKVINAVLPDYITLDFDEPNRFPNGRTPWEPISDKVFALGFLKMGGDCSGADRLPGVTEEQKRKLPRKDGKVVCTIETFADVGLQVTENDRPFFQDQFPYFAKPWFYGEQPAGTPYYWPTSRRLERPE